MSDSILLDFSILRNGDSVSVIGKLSPKKIVVCNSVFYYIVNNLEKSGGKELAEIEVIKEYCKNNGVNLEFSGMKLNLKSENDLILPVIELANETGSEIVTSDKKMQAIAAARNIPVTLIKAVEREFPLGRYFDENTMSVHMRENEFVYGKIGNPGSWKFEKISSRKLSRDELIELISEIVSGSDSIVETERENSTIIQHENFRIVIARPPFTDGYEITAARPVKLLNIEEYKISEKLMKRIKEQAEGILVAGSPGQGKTTFARALALFYAGNNKIVKTIESPRDLSLPDNITQLSLSHGSPEEIHDLLLLTRPDYTIFDEMRNTKDFMLFSDLRLSGVGMIGIVHATTAVDAVQRFIGRIELGVIPQIIDTVIFIDGGSVTKVYDLKISVKIPSGMYESDLARPIVTVSDFETGKLEYEVYSYGEETVVIPVNLSGSVQNNKAAIDSLEKKIRKFSKGARIDIIDGKWKLFLHEGEIPSGVTELLSSTEKELGIKIDLEKLPGEYKTVDYKAELGKRNITLNPESDVNGKEADIFIEKEFLLSAKVGKKNIIKINRESDFGERLFIALTSGKNVELRV